MEHKKMTLLKTNPTDPAAMFEAQDVWRRTKDYEAIGKINCIVLEAALGANTPERDVTEVMGVRLDWMNVPESPVLAQHGGQLMLISPVFPLPPLPDPKWKPTRGPYFAEVECKMCGGAGGIDSPELQRKIECGTCHGKGKAEQLCYDTAPMIPQFFAKYARGELAGTKFLVIEPVVQILVHPEGLPTYFIVRCMTDPGNATKTTLLVNPETGAGYFWGGIHDIQRF
jgi:hypothetical protein